MSNEIEPTYLVIRDDNLELHWVATLDQLPDVIGAHECSIQQLDIIGDIKTVYTFVVPATYNRDGWVGWSVLENCKNQYNGVRKWVYDCHTWVEAKNSDEDHASTTLFSLVYEELGRYEFDLACPDNLVRELIGGMDGSFIRAIEIPPGCEKFYSQFDNSIDEYPINTKLHIFTDENTVQDRSGEILVWILTDAGWHAYEYDEYTEMQDDVSQLVGNEKKQAL